MADSQELSPEQVEKIRNEEYEQGRVGATIYFMGKDVAEIKLRLDDFRNILYGKNGVVPRLEKVEGFVDARSKIERYIIAPVAVILIATAFIGLGGFFIAIYTGHWKP